jgi:phosphatidylglycerol:prolipoprotein diacylglycerol transferase
MFPVIQIGPLSVQSPGLILLIGLWVGLVTAERLATHFKIPGGVLYDLVFIGLIAGLIGGRLAFAVQSPGFMDNPLNLLSLTPTMLDPVGGAAAAMISMLIYGNRKSMPLRPVLDALTPFLAVMGIAAGFSHLASGRAYGTPTTLPWAVDLWGADRHPTQVYEIVLAGLILLLIRINISSMAAYKGKTFTIFLTLSAASHLFLYGLRGDSTFIGPGIRLEQVLAWMVLAVSLFWLRRFYRKPSEGDMHAA